MKTILVLSLLVFSAAWKTGGWTKDSFESNDLQIEKARQAAEKRYYERNDSNDEDVVLYPFAVYKQVVNGINYKLFFAAQNIHTNAVEFFDYVVYTGPFDKSLEFKVTSETKMELEDEKLQLTSRKSTKIDQAVSNYYSNRLNSESLTESIKVCNNVLYTMSFYVARTRAQDLLVVMEQENNEFEVVAEIRHF